MPSSPPQTKLRQQQQRLVVCWEGVAVLRFRHLTELKGFLPCATAACHDRIINDSRTTLLQACANRVTWSH